MYLDKNKQCSNFHVYNINMCICWMNGYVVAVGWHFLMAENTNNLDLTHSEHGNIHKVYKHTRDTPKHIIRHITINNSTHTHVWNLAIMSDSKKSPIWKYFQLSEDGKKTTCNLCKQQLAYRYFFLIFGSFLHSTLKACSKISNVFY